MIEFEQVEQLLQSRFGGLIRNGSHTEDGSGCLIEIANAAIGAAWSDNPTLWPDLRPINDAFTSDSERTRVLWPVLRAYWHWSEWGAARQRQIIERVIILTVQRIIAELPGLPPDVAQRCREATTLSAAGAAAGAAWAAEAAAEAAWAAEAAAEAAWAAEAAARAAGATWAAAGAAAWAARAAGAAWAAEAAAGESVLEVACALWIEALEVQYRVHAKPTTKKETP
jgi:biotin carboxyl carrier protein